MTSFTKSFKSSKVDYKTVFKEQETLLHINCTSISNCFTGDCPTTELHPGHPSLVGWQQGDHGKLAGGGGGGGEPIATTVVLSQRDLFFLRYKFKWTNQ